MIVAMTDLGMALDLKIIKGGLIAVAILGPLLAIIAIGVPLALIDLGPDTDMLLAFMMPMISGMIGMFSMVPAVYISANSIVGEREQNTLEPLLATPLTDWELLWGKVLSSLIPAVLLLASQVLTSAIGVNLVLMLAGKSLIMFPDLPGLFLLAAATPLLILAAISVMIIISGKVSRVYEAYQSVGAIIIVFFVPMVGPLSSMIGTDAPNLELMWFWNLLTFLVAIVMASLSWTIAVRRFNRDQMISRI